MLNYVKQLQDRVVDLCPAPGGNGFSPIDNEV
jgi:hypothetical protein